VEPEILQVDLAQVALELAAWGVDVQELSFLDTPPSAAFEKGRTLLTLIGALDSEGSITELGKKMLSLPLHPRLGAMVMSATPQEMWTACLLACLLEERDIIRGLRDNVPEDLAWRIECVDGSSGDDRIDRRASARVRDQARDLLSRANRVHGSNSSSESVVVHETGKLLLRAYPDWLWRSISITQWRCSMDAKKCASRRRAISCCRRPRWRSKEQPHSPCRIYLARRHHRSTR
jgi:ATP-dependent helicase HrpB